MIDFRYHVVSIVAIFLALTVGLVIGASILSKGVADSLRSDLSKSNNQIKSQQQQINELKTQADQQDKYIDDTAAQLVAGRLSGLCVAVVQIAGADSNAYADARTMIQKESGATICSETEINSSFTTTASQPILTTLLQEHTPRGQTFDGTKPGAAGHAELIAEALSTYQEPGAVPQTGGATPTATPTATPHTSAPPKPPASAHATTTAPSSTGTAGATMSADQALGTLQDFQTAGLITILTQPVAGQQATLSYVPAPTSANTDAENQTYLTLVESLRKDGAAGVVGGSADSADKDGLGLRDHQRRHGHPGDRHGR